MIRWRGTVRAFSLTELLILISVIGLLTAIVVPTMQRGFALGRRAICAGNLSELAKAYIVMDNDVASPESAYQVVLSDSWAGMLLPYLGFNLEALLCPEAGPKHMEAYPRFSQTNWYDVTWDFFNFPPVWNSQSFEDMYDGGSAVPSMWKMNDEDYDVWTANRQIGWGKMGHNKRYMPKYTPGKDPESYWILFEDAPDEWMAPNPGGGKDFVDFDIRVVEKSPGVYEMTFYDFSNSVARHGVTTKDGSTVWLPGSCEDGEGPYYFAAADTNYGMNAKKPAAGRPKILLMDYDDGWCDADTPPDEPEAFEKNISLRHLGKCNVVFADGTVMTMAVDQFTPREQVTYDRYWDPIK